MSTLSSHGGPSTAYAGPGRPDSPSLSAFPLLVWSPGHPRHGDDVHTEDGRVSAADVCRALRDTPDLTRLADQYHTSPAHVAQAISYGLAHGLLP